MSIVRSIFATGAAFAVLALVAAPPVAGQSGAESPEGPAILVVTAHPDDEAMFAATVWRVVREYGGVADLAVMTDGAGGYRFSTLAEPLYGLQLTDPEVARQALPEIRRRELRSGGEVVGFRAYHFLDEPDTGKFLKVDSVFTHLWNSSKVVSRLRGILMAGRYDLVLTLLPVPETHAHHKASALLLQRAVQSLPEADRPVVLGGFVGNDPSAQTFEVLDGWELSRIVTDVGPWILDRDQPLGLDGRLDYQIIVNWLIAAHRTQGTMQKIMNIARYERYWLYASNSAAARERGGRLLQAIGLEEAR